MLGKRLLRRALVELLGEVLGLASLLSDVEIGVRLLGVNGDGLVRSSEVGGVVEDDVVIGIAVIGDENATEFVASELNLGGVDLAEGSDDGLAINLKDSLVGVNGGLSEFRVNPVGDLDVSAGHVQLEAVAGLAVILVRVGHVSEEVDEGKGGVLVGKERLALLDHLGGEGELLAEKDEVSAVLSDILLSVEALVLSGTDLLDGGEHTLAELGLVLVDVIRVGTNLLVLILNLVGESVDVSPDVGGAGLQGLEGNEKLSLDLDSFLIVVLVPNGLSFVEVVDVLVEISAGEDLT